MQGAVEIFRSFFIALKLMQKSMSLKYEPASEPLHIYVKCLLSIFRSGLLEQGAEGAGLPALLSDAKVYEPYIR